MPRVYMYFMLRNGWYCQFLEPDLKTALRCRLTSRDAAKVREMFDRFAAERKLEDRQAFEYALENGRGSIWLNLSEEQYAKLQASSKS